MSIKDDFSVMSVPKVQLKEWLLKKHYAHKIPPISFSFGLYDADLILCGVCTYGPPARMLNNGYGIFGGNYEVDVFELNRLVTNEGLPSNALSFFVSRTLKLLTKPACIVTYADGNAGHHGFIYQATNWLYTGKTSVESIYINTNTGKVLHPRTVVRLFGTREEKSLPNWIELDKEAGGKYRYVKFIGTKKEVKDMNEAMVYLIEPYPKGDNKKYDANYTPAIQARMF